MRMLRAVMREAGRRGGLAAGKTRLKRVPPEQRQRIARLGGLERQRRWRERQAVVDSSQINDPSSSTGTTTSTKKS